MVTFWSQKGQGDKEYSERNEGTITVILLLSCYVHCLFPPYLGIFLTVFPPKTQSCPKVIFTICCDSIWLFLLIYSFNVISFSFPNPK